MRIEFTVYGKPIPQGSMHAVQGKYQKFPSIISNQKDLRPWRQDVATQAQLEMVKGGWAVQSGAIRVACFFFFQKPKSAKKSVEHKLTKPDIDKLLRGILDALTSVVFVDDSQVVAVNVFKAFTDGNPERVEVKVTEI